MPEEPTLEERIRPIVIKLLSGNRTDVITAKCMIESLPSTIQREPLYFELHSALLRLERTYSEKTLGPNHNQDKQYAKSKCPTYFP